MSIKEKRPFPVPAEVVMRSALFTLANLNAKLQVYNEETGVIVATVTKWMGMQKEEVVVKVRRFEQTSILEVEAPDPEKLQQLLSQISAYITDGAGRVQADATIQWVDITRQRENAARRQQLVDKARSILPGTSSGASETLPAVIDDQGNAIVPMVETETVEEVARMPIPDNPGVLVKNYQDKVIELKVDPQVFADRTSYLEACNACAATVLRGSKYCSACGRPLTLEAVQPELRNAANSAAQSSLRSGLIAIVAALVPFFLLVLPHAFGADASLSFLEKLGQSMTPIRLALSALVGVLPAMVFGYWAISQSQQAGWYQNLNALFDDPGRARATAGRVLGWIAVYMSVAWILVILVVLLVK